MFPRNKSEKNNEETNQTYGIRKAEHGTTTVHEYADHILLHSATVGLLAADHTPPNWPPLDRPLV